MKTTAFALAQTREPDLNGIWGATSLAPAVDPGKSVRWLLPLKGVDPEGTDVFKGLDRTQVNARVQAALQNRRRHPSLSVCPEDQNVASVAEDFAKVALGVLVS